MQNTIYDAIAERSLTIPENVSRPAPKGQKFKVLILDDNNFDQTRIKRICGQTGLEISTSIASDISEFSHALDEDVFDVIFIDYTLPKGDGLAAQRLVSDHPRNYAAAVVMISSNLRTDVAVASMKQGSLDCLDKESLNPEKLRELMIASANAFLDNARRGFGDLLIQHREDISKDVARAVREEMQRSGLIDAIDKRMKEYLTVQGNSTTQQWDIDTFLAADEPFSFK